MKNDGDSENGETYFSKTHYILCSIIILYTEYTRVIVVLAQAEIYE